MRRSVCLPTLLLAALLATPAAAQEAAQEEDPRLEVGRELTDAFFAGELEGLWDRMSDAVHGQLGTVEQLAGFRTQAMGQLGDETEILSENMVDQNGMDVYVRRSNFANVADTIIETIWVTDAEGVIQGFQIRPAQQ